VVGTPGRREPDSQQTALRLSDRLRKMAVEAPLQSLLLAFLLGVLVARRRYRRANDGAAQAPWLETEDLPGVVGFFDLAIAAPFMKGGPSGLGHGSNLFHQGMARETGDPTRSPRPWQSRAWP